jgi:hypothetical protein
MKQRALVAASVISLASCLTLPSRAFALNFNVTTNLSASLDNYASTGTLTLDVQGLVANQSNQNPTDVIILADPIGIPSGTVYSNTYTSNSGFTVDALGNLTSINDFAIGNASTVNAATNIIALNAGSQVSGLGGVWHGVPSGFSGISIEANYGAAYITSPLTTANFSAITSTSVPWNAESSLIPLGFVVYIVASRHIKRTMKF